MKDIGPERGDKGDGVVVKVGDTGEEPEEVALDKFFRRNPEFLTTVVNDLVLVRVAINGISTGQSVEKVRE